MKNGMHFSFSFFIFSFSFQQVSNFTDLYFHIRHFSERKFRWNGIFFLH